METIKTIYIHLIPDKLPFSEELTHSHFVYNEVPDYTYTSIKQTKKISNSDCILLTNNNIEEYHSQIQEFFDLCKNNFPSFYKDPFWLLTLLRIYTVYLYCTKNNISSFVHLENDNLIYKNYDSLKKLPDGCYFTKVGPECGSAGFMFCNNFKSFETTINSLKHLLKKGEHNIRPYTSYDFLSEMILIDLLVRGNKAEYLPLTPYDKYYDITDCVFDGASYGQYIGGTNNNHGPGWFGLNHYLGQLLSQNRAQIIFDKTTPYTIIDNTKADIFNLHIHSKQLQNYV
jgi:hypothetical protein